MSAAPNLPIAEAQALDDLEGAVRDLGDVLLVVGVALINSGTVSPRMSDALATIARLGEGRAGDALRAVQSLQGGAT